MFTQKASQIGANTTLGNSLKTLQVFVKQKEENTEWSLAKKSKASLFLNNENFT